MSFVFGGMVYDVELKDHVHMDNSKKLGMCIFKDTVIEISKDMSLQRMQETFVHELIHAILYEAGLEDNNETFVESFGRVLYQVLKDNQIHFGEEFDKKIVEQVIDRLERNELRRMRAKGI